MDTEVLYRNLGSSSIKKFSEKIIPCADLPIYGVRVPLLRTLAKDIDTLDFPIKYHEDVILRGFIISKKKIPLEEKLLLINTQLPLLKTWDETDTFASALKFKKDEIDSAYEYFLANLNNEMLFARRLSVVWIMSNRNKLESSLKEQLDALTKVKTDDGYYIEMALAWALSFYYISDSDLTRPYIEASSDNVKRMAYQKIRDSRRVK